VTPFDFIAVALSIILGLGITHLLSSAVRIVIARKRVRLDWIPFTWAFCIFALHLQYWWAIYELNTIHTEWTLGFFLSFIAAAVLLYVAAHFILSDHGENVTDMRDVFQEHGKYALLLLSVYVGCGFVINWVYFNNFPFQLANIVMWLLLVLPIVAFFKSDRRTVVILTVLYFLLAQYTNYANSPLSY